MPSQNKTLELLYHTHFVCISSRNLQNWDRMILYFGCTSHAYGRLLLHKVVVDESMLVLDDTMLQVPVKIKSSVVNSNV